MASRKDPTVAVIIPFYNGSKWIERAVQSVVDQTVKPKEFVVVNDGSRPDERDVLRICAEKYGFRVLDKVNGGQGSARNAGVWATEAEFIAFLDQDDYFLPQHIEDLLLTIPENDPRLGYVYADLCKADEVGYISDSNILRYQTRAGRHPKQGSAAELISDDMFVLPSASLIKRTAFKALGGFDEQFIGYEDDDLFLRMFRNGYTNYFLDKPVTVWCQYRTSTSYSVKMSQSRFKYFKKLSAIYPDDIESNIFYFRDCLIGRFGHKFLDEPLKARQEHSPNLNTLIEILREYSNIVDASETVSSEYKDAVKRRLQEVQALPKEPKEQPAVHQNVDAGETVNSEYKDTVKRRLQEAQELLREPKKHLPFHRKLQREIARLFLTSGLRTRWRRP